MLFTGEAHLIIPIGDQGETSDVKLVFDDCWGNFGSFEAGSEDEANDMIRRTIHLEFPVIMSAVEEIQTQVWIE